MMEINIRDDRKLVEVWLTNSESRDRKIQEQLKPLYRKCKEKKYLVVVYASGKQDLTELTRSLLCDHRRRAAQREVELERQSGVVMGA